ncbi:MAG: histidine triad nucleotide-binding protein [Clostridia bacterium]
MNDNCLFCKIIKKEIPSNIVYENEYVLAFHDIHPVTPVHILVIPKMHIKNINEITEENLKYISEIFKAIKEVAKICNIYEDGYRVISNCGKNAQQEIPHLHFHILGGKKLGIKIV